MPVNTKKSKIESGLSCSKCGSRNIKMSDVMPGDSWGKRLMAAMTKSAQRMGGTKYLVCKDCGNVTVVQVL